MTDFATEILKLAAAILAPIIAGLLVAILVRVLKKLGLDLSAEQQAKAEYLARQAILRVEEYAANKLKNNQVVVASEEKLQKATTDLITKVPGITQKEAEDLIHSELPKVGAGASNFLKATVVAATTTK